MDPRAALQPSGSARSQLRELSERLSLRRGAVPLILQSEAAECGLACLAMVAGYHGHRIDLPSLRRRFPPSVRGVSMRGLIQTAAALHLSGRALRLELPQLAELRTPCILHWDLTHFVVLLRVRGDKVTIHDPGVGRRVYRMDEVSRHFTGIALELTPTNEFKPLREERPARLRDLWSHMQGLPGSLATVFALSALLQVFGMAAPFYTQFVVDEVLAKRDANLLLVLLIGFSLVLAIRTIVSFLRDYTVLYASHLLSFQMGTNLLSHLIRLPLAYFEKRHLGDVMSRVRSLGPIEELLTTGFVGAVLDGLMSAILLALMFVYSPMLSVISIGTAALFSLARIALYRPIRQLREEGIVARAQEDTTLIEVLRGIQAVKMLGVETSREAAWQNRRAESMSSTVRATRWELGFKAGNALLFGLENLITVALAAQLVFEQQFTVGMLYAYTSYKSQFTERISGLIDWALRYRMLDVHLTRIADIVHTPEERGLRGPAELGAPLKGRIELRGVSFRYSESDPYVLRDVSFCIEEGSCVGIVGRSGSGKTTLLKLVLGLLEPTQGEILIDGQRLSGDGLRAYRGQIGAVMQEDHFFEGTVAENISAFDAEEDLARVEAAARAACVHDDIAALPMGYRSWLGNMGANLSGGQRQRILLARAFYRQPPLLLLDEGTANLDPMLLDQVWSSIAKAPITRIVATHQHVLLATMDQVLIVESGCVRVQANVAGASD
jgi:ATP-binding cassette, subfamily B, bacterial CvaB/MchF/RaxB